MGEWRDRLLASHTFTPNDPKCSLAVCKLFLRPSHELFKSAVFGVIPACFCMAEHAGPCLLRPGPGAPHGSDPKQVSPDAELRIEDDAGHVINGTAAWSTCGWRVTWRLGPTQQRSVGRSRRVYPLPSGTHVRSISKQMTGDIGLHRRISSILR